MVELLIGPIASGKSFYSSKRVKKRTLVINDDAITMALHGGNYGSYDPRFKGLYKSLEHRILEYACDGGYDVVIDRPNLKRSTRVRYIEIAKSLDVPVVGVIFPMFSPECHAGRRTLSDSRGMSYETWLQIAECHHKVWEPPTISEGFDNLVPLDVALQMHENEAWV